MDILVTSKMAFETIMERQLISNENVTDQKDTFFVSILNTPPDHLGDGPPYFQNNENVMVLYFDDVEEDITKIMPDGEPWTARALTMDQARDLFAFIHKHKDKNNCIIHCAAGVSRSGAVGTFINDYTESNWDAFKRKNPHIHPNNLVVRLLRKAMDESLQGHID